MADSKMAAEEVTATNTTAASGIANDDNGDNGDHTYANVPAPAPANTAESTTAPNTAANSNEAAPPSSSTSTDNADGGASASDEPKPKVTNNMDFSFMIGLSIDDMIRITMIMSSFRTLLSDAFDENDVLHKVLTLIQDARQQTTAASSPPSMTTTEATSI